MSADQQLLQRRSTSKRKKTYSSLKEWYANASGIMLDKLCVCGGSLQDQVLLEDDDDDHHHDDDANSERWSMMCASTPLAFRGNPNGNRNGDEPSICRIDTMPMENTKASVHTRRSTSRAAVAVDTRSRARRPLRSPIRVAGTGSSYFDDDDDDEEDEYDVCDHKRLDEAAREYMMSPSFSQYQYQDQEENEENSMIRDAPRAREHFMSPSFSQYQDLSSSLSGSSRSRLSSLDKQQQQSEDGRDPIFVLSTASSSSSFHKPSNKDKVRTMKYPDGPPPISPTNTYATVSLSQSMSQDDYYEEHDYNYNYNDYDYEHQEERLESGSAVSTQVVSHCFRPKRQKIVLPSSNDDENTDDDKNGVEHEAYGFLLRMRPHNYLREDQQGIDYAGGVMFQSPMRMLDDADSDDDSYSIRAPSMPELE